MIADRMRPRFAALAAGVAALILYGSLFPFEFHACAPAVLLSSSTIPSDRGDLLSNVLLYLPLGFFGYLALGRSKWSALAVTAVGTALSFAIEMTQSCDNSRVPSLADVLANSGGTLAGSVAAVAWRGEASFPALALACWIGSRLLPYLPSTHLEKFRAAIRALFSSPRPLDVFHYFALWLAAAACLDALIGSARSRSRLAAAIALVVAARVVIVDVAPASAELLGGVGALLAWWWLPPLPARARIVAALFTVLVILTALEPFHFLAAPRPFGWIPFLSFMRSPRESASRVFLEKSFIYGALVWLPVRAGLSFRAATMGATALVLALRLAQTYLPLRSAEVTDALMVLMLAAVMKVMRG